MKDFTIEELEVMLCSTGYLPPRNENELLFFEQMYENYNSRLKDMHVDIESIVNGTCQIVNDMTYNLVPSEDALSMAADANTKTTDYFMAARNFNTLPKEVLIKMRNQHQIKDKDEE